MGAGDHVVVSLSILHREQTPEYQVGYTTGLVDLVNWVVSFEPQLRDTIDQCLSGLGTVDLSISFDNFVEGAFDETASAPVFVGMLDGMCSTDLSSTVAVRDREGDVVEVPMSVFHSVGSYREQTPTYQVGYTAGLMDLIYWIVAKDPQLKNKIDACMDGRSASAISALFDGIMEEAGGQFDQFGSSLIFVGLLDEMCDTNVMESVVASDPAGDVGDGGEKIEGCTPVSTLPEGLLVELARSGQLTVLYEAGALC